MEVACVQFRKTKLLHAERGVAYMNYQKENSI